MCLQPQAVHNPRIATRQSQPVCAQASLVSAKLASSTGTSTIRSAKRSPCVAQLDSRGTPIYAPLLRADPRRGVRRADHRGVLCDEEGGGERKGVQPWHLGAQRAPRPRALMMHRSAWAGVAGHGRTGALRLALQLLLPWRSSRNNLLRSHRQVVLRLHPEQVDQEGGLGPAVRRMKHSPTPKIQD